MGGGTGAQNEMGKRTMSILQGAEIEVHKKKNLPQVTELKSDEIHLVIPMSLRACHSLGAAVFYYF